MCQVDPSNEPNRPHISSRYQIFKQHRQKTTRRAPTQKRRNTMQPSIQISPQPIQNHPIPPQSLPTAFPPPVKRYLGKEQTTRKGKISSLQKFRHIASFRAAQSMFAARIGVFALQFFRRSHSGMRTLI
jgi:hypothetical protein